MSNGAPGTNLPIPIPSTASADSDPKNWSQFSTNDGRKYYFNKISKKTQWEMPSALKSKNQKLDCPWQEFTSENGRKYYYNVEIKKTQWNIPQEYQEFLSKNKKTQSRTFVKIVEDKISMGGSNREREGKSHGELVSTFKELLKDHNVQVDWDWNKTMRAIISDARYRPLTISEKKSVYREYIEEKKQKDREDRRKRIIKQKEDFFKLLKECKDLHLKSSYRKIILRVKDDMRYKAVEKEELRREFFDDYIYHLEKEQRKNMEKFREKYKDEFRKVLEDCAKEKILTFKSVWRKLPDNIRNNPSYEKLEKVDRLQVWDRFIRKLNKAEDERKSKERLLKRKEEKKNRSLFWNLMTEYQKKGTLHAAVRWKEFKPVVKGSQQYQNVINQNDSPRDMFEDFMDLMDMTYKEDKRRLKSIMNVNKVKIKVTTKFEEFLSAMGKDEKFKGVDKENVKIFFSEYIMRRKNKWFDKFRELLKSTEEITTISTYEQSLPSLSSHSSFANCTEDEKKGMFDEYIQKLKRKEEKKKRKREKSEERQYSRKLKKIKIDQETTDEQLKELQRRKQQILDQLKNN